MCGIAGWIDLAETRAPNKGLVKAMADAIRHRGPDGEGFHFEPGVALAHRRLAIIDLNTGQQPMYTEGGRIAIVFNGEIYNYRELQEELRGKGHVFATRSDTEVILRAWLEWGEGCTLHLHGMFAFALWDRQKQTLFLARDRLGEKPLYYAVLPDQSLAFASELKALLVDSRVDRRLDARAIEDFFALGYIADPKTIYANVRKLEAGHSLTLRRGALPADKQYWDAKPQEFQGGDLDAAAENLRERLMRSVKSQLVADVPVGTFLSGGVDSSAITALAAGQVPDALNTFTIGFDDRDYDERQYAAEVAEKYGVRSYSENVSWEDLDTVRALPGIFDEPFGDSSAMPTFRLAQLASRTVKVALSGDGGDELFAGYRRYLFHNREEKLRKLIPGQIRKPLFGLLGRVYPQLDWLPRPLRARQTFRELGVDAAEGFFHNISILDDATRSRLFSAALRRDIAGYRASDEISRHMAAAPSDDPVAIAQYVDIKTWLVGDILTKVDRTAMACSLEVRVPMLDDDFVNWALGLPRLLKLSGREGKAVLKRALEPLLPHHLLYRRKQGFSVPLAAWFRGPLGDAFARDIAAGSDLEAFIDLGFVRQLLDAHRRGYADNSRALWLLWMFKGFLETTHKSAAITEPAFAGAEAVLP